MDSDTVVMCAQLIETQRRLQQACFQIQSLNVKKEDFVRRYLKAVKANDKRFRYSLRMRIVTVEGMIDCYYQYATMKEKEMLDLRFKLYGEIPEYEEDLDIQDSETDDDMNVDSD